MADVILVDDDKIVLKILAQKFEQLGLSVQAINDPRIGLQKIIELRPKIAVLDLIMPELTGRDLAIKLSENLVFNTTSIYLLTASDLTTNEKIGLGTLGFYQILKKPFSDQDIQQIVNEHFKKVA